MSLMGIVWQSSILDPLLYILQVTCTLYFLQGKPKSALTPFQVIPSDEYVILRIAKLDPSIMQPLLSLMCFPLKVSYVRNAAEYVLSKKVPIPDIE